MHRGATEPFQPRAGPARRPGSKVPAFYPDITMTTRPEVLDDRAQRVLEFERQWWGHSGAKEQRIRAEFGWTAARYYQVLNAVIDTAVAVRYDPVLVGRLREVRDDRAERRRTRRPPVDGAA